LYLVRLLLACGAAYGRCHGQPLAVLKLETAVQKQQTTILLHMLLLGLPRD
jgi:hypothetical protein